MKSEDSAWVAKSKFMKNFYNWKNWHREKNHFWVKSGAEDFLELKKTRHNDEIFTFKNALDVIGNEVDRIACDDCDLVLVKFS